MKRAQIRDEQLALSVLGQGGTFRRVFDGFDRFNREVYVTRLYGRGPVSPHSEIPGRGDPVDGIGRACFERLYGRGVLKCVPYAWAICLPGVEVPREHSHPWDSLHYGETTHVFTLEEEISP